MEIKTGETLSRKEIDLLLGERVTEVDNGVDAPLPTLPQSEADAVPEPYLTGPKLRAMPESVMDAVIEQLVKTAAASRVLRLRLIDMEDRLADANDQLEWSRRSMDVTGLELERLAADNAKQSAHVLELGIQVTQQNQQLEDSDGAMSLLGLAVGLLTEEGIEKDDPRIRELVGNATRVGIGFRTPIRSGPLGPAARSTADGAGVVLPFVRRQAPTVDGNTTEPDGSAD